MNYKRSKEDTFLLLFLISVNLYSTQEILALGFGSCLHQDRSMDILKTIEKKELDLFMFIGDNVYGDQEDGELDKLIRTYKKQYKNLAIVFGIIYFLPFSAV